VLLGNVIDDKEAEATIAKLLFLEKLSPEPITMYINSPGGSATAGLAILETIESLKPKLHTFCPGQAHSLAAIILGSGTHGHRGAATDAIISFSCVRAGEPMTPEKQMYLNRIETNPVTRTYRATGMSKQQIADLFRSEKPLTSSEAKDLGIIDQIYRIQPAQGSGSR
jgi:ATP-dependent Clp protease protease subunit